METGKRVGHWLGRQGARLLVSRGGTPLLLVGTLALAGLGASVGRVSADQPATGQAVLQLTSPRTFCDSNWEGKVQTVCHILASQVHTVPNLGCYADPDGDGTFICLYPTRPQTNPPTNWDAPSSY